MAPLILLIALPFIFLLLYRTSSGINCNGLLSFDLFRGISADRYSFLGIISITRTRTIFIFCMLDLCHER